MTATSMAPLGLARPPPITPIAADGRSRNAESRSRHWSLILGPFPDATDIVSSNLVYVSKAGLPQSLQDRLVRLAAFENPEFYRAQAMRLPTFAKPRLICCACLLYTSDAADDLL